MDVKLMMMGYCLPELAGVTSISTIFRKKIKECPKAGISYCNTYACR